MEMIKPKYRTLWTWDFATCWDNSFFGRNRGSSGANSRRVNFLNDYKRLINFASEHHMNGVVIWGAVRAHHDGFEQLKELVKYGREKGVRVMPGVSAFSYGGICYDPRRYFDGVFDVHMTDHPYSLGSWLKKHPEYAAISANGKPYDYGPFNTIACPSRQENVEWFKEGLGWLYDEFDVDGIQVEVGDYAVCHCPLCTERRKNAGMRNDFYTSDMISTYTAAIDVSLAAKKDPWVICETYSNIADIPKGPAPGSWASMPREDRELLSALPEEAILQWAVDTGIGGYSVIDWSDNVYTPSKNNITRIHTGSQWSINGPAAWGVNLVWEMVSRSRGQGLNGVSIFGEESPFSPPNEANYLALEEASGFGKDNPECSEELFYAQTLDPLYGGHGLAKRWKELYAKGSMLMLWESLSDKILIRNVRQHVNSNQPLEVLTGDMDFRKKALEMSASDRIKEIESYFDEARSISKTLSGEACARWSWLENKLWNMRYLINTKV